MHLNSTLYTPKKNLEISLKFKKVLRNSVSYFGYKIRRTDGMSIEDVIEILRRKYKERV